MFGEPGRRLVRRELASNGDALPWVDAAKFAELCIERGLSDLAAARDEGGVSFFDRSVVDALSALEHMGRPLPRRFAAAVAAVRYHETVFITPPWEELFANDAERRHSFTDACAEYERLLPAYAARGYQTVLVPKAPTASRADFVLAQMR